MEKIEAIIFDLGGVILDIDYNLTRVAFEKLGVAHFEEMYSQATADTLFRRLETGVITEDAFYSELNTCTGLNLSAEEIKNAWNAMLLSFREKSLQFLDKIQPDYKLYLLSNTNFIHIDAFKKMYYLKERRKPFEEYFNKVFYSCEIGFRKPDSICYQCVLDDLSIKAGSTLFIDDSVQNIEGAKNAGMQTVHLLPGKNIEDLGL